MSNLEIFITNPMSISTTSFYPRNYDPKFLFVRDGMKHNPSMQEYIIGDVKGGSTPPAYLFRNDENGIFFIKTAAITRHFINYNDLQRINENFHRTTIKRSITRPYDVIYSMTGKFMGKAAMCPAIITEMNMSQNSVVLHTNNKLEAAFLTIYLNSQVNRIQVRGTYSITKQKYMNQGKIATLKVIPYSIAYEYLMREYLTAFDNYYESLWQIKEIITKFNADSRFIFSDTPQYGYIIEPGTFDKRMLVPNYYRKDISETINNITGLDNYQLLDPKRLSKGDEVGSSNYTDVGVPFIKTSDIINYGIDYEPDCYCPEYLLSQLEQKNQKGDIIFAKDGKPGEVAIIESTSKVIISSGLVKYHPINDEDRYWVFLLLASKYGEAYFKKWFVIASTMMHLRKDFFTDFKIPHLSEYAKKEYIIPLGNAFEKKAHAHERIEAIKNLVEQSYTDDKIPLDRI